MTPRWRGALFGTVMALQFWAGYWVGSTRTRPAPPPDLPARAEAPRSPWAPMLMPTVGAGGSTLRERHARERRRSAEALERAYRANLAREGLTPRIGHEVARERGAGGTP